MVILVLLGQVVPLDQMVLLEMMVLMVLMAIRYCINFVTIYIRNDEMSQPRERQI